MRLRFLTANRFTSGQCNGDVWAASPNMKAPKALLNWINESLTCCNCSSCWCKVAKESPRALRGLARLSKQVAACCDAFGFCDIRKRHKIHVAFSGPGFTVMLHRLFVKAKGQVRGNETCFRSCVHELVMQHLLFGPTHRRRRRRLTKRRFSLRANISSKLCRAATLYSIKLPMASTELSSSCTFLLACSSCSGM